MIRVVCDAASHPTKPSTVTMLEKSADGAWHAPLPRRRNGHYGPIRRRGKPVGPEQTIDDDAGRACTGNDLLEQNATGVPDAELLASKRTRFVFLCPLCGDSLPVRAEKLYPLLDSLAGHDIATISLVALRGRL